MALLDKVSKFSLPTSPNSKKVSGKSQLLNQATTIKSNSPLNNPNSTTKLNQSPVIENKSPIGQVDSAKLGQSPSIKNQSPIGTAASDKLGQSPVVRNNSPVGQAKSSKTLQTNSSFFNVGKSSQFSRSGMIKSFAGTTSPGASVPPPPPPPHTAYELFVTRTTTAGATQENLSQIQSFFNNVNTLSI